MTSVAVLVPVLARPQRAAPVAASIRSSDRRAHPVFLCTPGDDEEIAAVRAAGETPVIVPWRLCPGDYSRKMNYGFVQTDDEWVFLGADDLVFHRGWFDACLRAHAVHGACVVGTNDMGNARVIAGRHSTHTLVHRDYLECGTVDEAGKILHEGYTHAYTDDEFVQTAQARRTYAHAHDALVEHLHPNWSKGDDDETYRRGMEHFADDRRLYERRQYLWRGGPRTRASRRRA